jgi:L-ascorbate metabolism protein UlaG (beta-lactamase superfamily)
MFNDGPHTDGKIYFNPGETSARGLRDLIKWKLTSRAARWPDQVEVIPQALPPAPTADGVVAAWVGHATFVLRTRSATILTDPIFSDRAGPVSWLGPKRVAAPGIDFAAIPRVDLVLLSHDHFDHCDLPSLRALARRDDPWVVCPLGHRALLARAGLKRVTELDWWGSTVCPPGTEVTLVPARHWSRRSPFSTNRRLWGGFVLRSGGRQVYFAGDSGYEEGLFSEIRTRCGVPDLALVPIGAYEPRWFMASAHMNPAEALLVHREVGARKSVAMHWGTFQLTDEGFKDPAHALDAARGPAEDFVWVHPGQSVSA